MKAADISDNVITALVEKASPLGGASRFDIQDELSHFPPKVVFAKLRQMVNKGRLTGCPCGCRGGFTIPKSEVKTA